MLYEHRKHEGSLPIIGVNTFLKEDQDPAGGSVALSRSTEDEKLGQIERLRAFQSRNREQSDDALSRVKQAAIENENVFAALMDAVRYCSLGQIADALYDVGGQYRRNM